MNKVFVRPAAVILSATVLLTAAGCRAKREVNSSAESSYCSHRIAASSQNDSLSLTIDIALDSVEIALVNPATAGHDMPPTGATRSGAKAYGVRATLRSQRLTGAEMSEKETESASSEEASSNEVNAAVAPLWKSLLAAALIIFPILLIFIHIKRKKSMKNNYL